MSNTSVSQWSLPVLAFAFFWLLPFSPFIAIAAVAKTRNSMGWTRTLARSAAFLCSAYTMLLAVALCYVAIRYT